jgi:hypothetical protein
MPEATSPRAGDWFRTTSGPEEGDYHLVGWYLSAIATTEGWFGFATCPRCFAMVQSDMRKSWQDHKAAHERWHAATDWPVPDAITDPMPQ